MKSVVIGGCGFVGRVLAEKLIGENHEVLILDKLTHEVSKEFRVDLEKIGCKVEICDASKVDELNSILPSHADFMFHFAANSDIKPKSDGGNADFYDTLGTTLALAEVLKIKKVNHLVFASSSAIYGNLIAKIKTNTHNINPLKPISNYGIAKLSSEYILENLYFSKKVSQISVFRFPNVVGRFATHGILFDFFMKRKSGSAQLEVLGNGNQNKPYLHVDDLTEEILRAIKWANPGLNFFNLSPIDTISVKEIVKLFLQITNWDVPVKYQDTDFGWVGDVPSYSFDLSDGTGLPASSKNAITKAINELKNESRFR